MSTRSRSIATHVIAPGDNSDALVTGTNPSSMPRGFWTRRLVRLEAEHLRGILRGDLASILFGSPGKDAIQKLLGLRPGRLGVREVAPPEHVLDADRVAQLDAEVVLHELHEHVATPVVARQESLPSETSPGEHRTPSTGEVHFPPSTCKKKKLVLERADLQP